MKIVHVIRQFHPARGGLETVVDNLTSRQASSGHQVKVVTLNKIFGKPGELRTADALGSVEIARIPFFGSQRYPIAPDVLKNLRDADIVRNPASLLYVQALKFLQTRALPAPARRASRERRVRRATRKS